MPPARNIALQSGRSTPTLTSVLQTPCGQRRKIMKRDAMDSRLPRRPWQVVAAVLVVTLCGLVGLPAAFNAAGLAVALDPAHQPTFHESVFVNGRASAVPDSAMLSAADVERALPPSPHAALYPSQAS
jgi:hypothetical protein